MRSVELSGGIEMIKKVMGALFLMLIFLLFTAPRKVSARMLV